LGLTNFPNGLTQDYSGILYAEIADVSAAASSWSAALPFDVEILGAYVTIDTAVTVGDAAVTFEIGGTAITSMLVTIVNGTSAAGATYAAVAPTAEYTLAAGTPIEVITDGGSTDASKGTVGIAYKRV